VLLICREDVPIVAWWGLIHESPTVQLDAAHVLVADPDMNVGRSNSFSFVLTTNRN
jgi:hypothetical protein